MAVLLPACAGSAYADYTFTTLDDPLGGDFTAPWGISGSTIVGQSGRGGFSESGGVFTTVLSPTGSTCVLTGISGDIVVGYYQNGGQTHGFSLTGGVYTILDAPAAAGTGSASGTFPEGISGDTVVGYYTDASGAMHGFSETGGSYATLDYDLPSPLSGWAVSGAVARGVSGGTVVGTILLTQGAAGTLYSFTETGGVFSDLKGLVAWGISGDTVVGYGIGIGPAGGYTDVGVMETGGVSTTLVDPLGGRGTFIDGLDAGTIVGRYEDAAGTHGFTATENVPEPASLGLLVGGIAIMALRGRRAAPPPPP